MRSSLLTKTRSCAFIDAISFDRLLVLDGCRCTGVCCCCRGLLQTCGVTPSISNLCHFFFDSGPAPSIFAILICIPQLMQSYGFFRIWLIPVVLPPLVLHHIQEPNTGRMLHESHLKNRDRTLAPKFAPTFVLVSYVTYVTEA